MLELYWLAFYIFFLSDAHQAGIPKKCTQKWKIVIKEKQGKNQKSKSVKVFAFIFRLFSYLSELFWFIGFWLISHQKTKIEK